MAGRIIRSEGIEVHLPELATDFQSLSEEYQHLVRLAEETHKITVAPLQLLLGGWSGAVVYLVSVSNKRLGGDALYAGTRGAGDHVANQLGLALCWQLKDIPKKLSRHTSARWNSVRVRVKSLNCFLCWGNWLLSIFFAANPIKPLQMS